MKAHQNVFLVLAAFYLLTGCATTIHDAVHHPQNPNAVAVTLPNRIALLPVKVAIHEIGVGGSVEEVPRWSRKGCQLVDCRVREQLTSRSGIHLVIPSGLSGQDQQLLEQHRTLYEQVAANRLQIQNIPAWKSKIEHPDDAIGPGLAPLKDTLGAEGVLFVAGDDYCASGGRVATFIVAALFGAIVPMGHSVIHVGLVDVETGAVLWTDTVYSDTYSLKDETAVETMVDQAFLNFPKPARPGDDHAHAQ